MHLTASAARPCDLRVVASLPNPLAARVLGAPGARAASSLRRCATCSTAIVPLSSFVRVDRRPELQPPGVGDARRPRGSRLASFHPDRDRRARRAARCATRQPAERHSKCTFRFSPPTPPRDTNRAGESYAATLLSTLLDHGWDAASGVVDDGLIRKAALRAAAAAALELDLVDFGFPADAEIDAALVAGLDCRLLSHLRSSRAGRRTPLTLAGGRHLTTSV